MMLNQHHNNKKVNAQKITKNFFDEILHLILF